MLFTFCNRKVYNFCTPQCIQFCLQLYTFWCTKIVHFAIIKCIQCRLHVIIAKYTTFILHNVYNVAYLITTPSMHMLRNQSIDCNKSKYTYVESLKYTEQLLKVYIITTQSTYISSTQRIHCNDSNYTL